jgi:hypothetical protein
MSFSMSTFFCSALARAENEQLFGTAKQIRVFIALEYPSAWKRKAIESDLLAPEVRQFAAAVRERVPEMRFLLLRQKESRGRKPACYIAFPREHDPAVHHFELDEYRDLRSLDVAALFAGHAGIPARREPMFLVCTHAQHDKCCAKYGNAVVEAAAGRLWESSHLGGCRFAANLLCLPHGLLYGFLAPEDALQVIREYDAGRILLEKFRGRVWFPKPVQAAEYFLRKETGMREIGRLRFLDSVQAGPGAWITKFAVSGSATGYSVEHTVSRSQSPRLLACADVEPEFVWINHLSAIAPLALPE